ncbi:MAG: helix-turn-helix domain-containing protein [Spirochaetaceae bacterium]|jgi:addiction module HigA family antidote|nr:helix-turn-helix domain-containing protein [Spirochaetaceae bacterium]
MPRGKSAAGGAGKTPAAELEKQIKKFGLSQAQVAKDVGLSVMTLKKLLDGKAKVDIERALVFAKYFGTSADYWIELQKKAGLAEAKKDNKLQKQLKDLKKAKPVKAEKAGPGVKKSAVGAKRGPKAGAKKAAPKKTVKKAVKRTRSTSSSSTPPVSSFFS